MTKLSDTQRVLLSTASGRDDGNLLPLPATVRPGGGTARAMVALIRRGLAEERHATEQAASGGEAPYGVFVTAAGLEAIGVEPRGEPDGAGDEEPQPAPSTTLTTSKPPSKTASVVALLQRSGGATLPELIAATGWLPHTTRAALTGLRKKGHALEKGRRDGATCYRIGAAA